MNSILPPHRCVVLLLSVCALLINSIAGAQQLSDAPLAEAVVEAASGSGEHLWVIIRDPEPAGESSAPPSKPKQEPYRLCYQGPGMAPDALAPLRRIGFLPGEFIAIGDKVFLVTARKGTAGGLDVFSVTVVHNETLNVYYAEPADRMELHPPLPTGELLDLAEFNNSLVALMDLPDAPKSDEGAAATGLSLLRMRPGGWEHLAVPGQIGVERPILLATSGRSGEQLHLIQPSTDDPAQSVLHTRRTGNTPDTQQPDEGTWAARTVALDCRSIHYMTRSMGQAVAVQQDADESQISVSYLRSSGLISLASFPAPEQPWFLVGGKRLRLITASDTGPQVMVIDPITGDRADAQQLRHHTTQTAGFWFGLLLLAGAISVALLIVLIRPAQKEEIQLPEKTELLPPMQRLMALLIDAFPPAVAILLVTRCSVAELLQAPLLPPNLIMSNSYLLLVGLTIVHTTVTEILTGTTLGKSMVGARVINTEGDRPAAGPCLLRAFGKLLTMLVLPIALIGVLNRNQQGVDDLLGRTLVVHEPDEPVTGSDDDR